MGTQTEVSTQILENQVRDIHLKLKNVIQTSISEVDSFQADRIKNFSGKKHNLGQVHCRRYQP